MRKIAFVLALVCGLTMSAEAQKGKVAMAKSYFASGNMDMAKRLIDEVMEANGTEGSKVGNTSLILFRLVEGTIHLLL